MTTKNFRVRNGLTIGGTTSGSTSFDVGATGTDINLTLPTAYAASNGYVLASTTTGVLSWVANPDTNTTYTIDAGTTTGGANFNLAGSDSSIDTIKIANGTAITAVATDANTITITNTGVTSNIAGTGIGVSAATGAVTITNTGVTSAVAGTGVSVSAATGDVTFSIGQSVATTADPTFNSIQLTAGTIKSSAGVTAITVSNNDATIADFLTVGGDMRVSGNTIYSSTNTALELSGQNVSTYGDLTIQGGDLTLNGSTSGTVTLSSPAVAGTQAYTLPTAVPAVSGYVLSSTTGGVMSWVAGGGAGTTYTIDASTTTGGANFNLVGSDASTDTIKFAGSGSTTVTRTDANTITISSTGGGGSSLPMPLSSTNATNNYSLCPGNLSITNLGSSITMAAQSVNYTPFYVTAPITLTEVALAVRTATTLVGCNAMIYISEVNVSGATGWQPTANLSGGYLGEITNITTTGQKTITGLTTVLPAGAYLMVVQFSNYTGTLQISGPGSQCIIGSGYAFNSNDQSAYNWRRTGVTYTSGTPAAVANWSQFGGAPAGISNYVLCKWTVN